MKIGRIYTQCKNFLLTRLDKLMDDIYVMQHNFVNGNFENLNRIEITNKMRP
jgi:uncharacterized protein